MHASGANLAATMMAWMPEESMNSSVRMSTVHGPPTGRASLSAAAKEAAFAMSSSPERMKPCPSGVISKLCILAPLGNGREGGQWRTPTVQATGCNLSVFPDKEAQREGACWASSKVDVGDMASPFARRRRTPSTADSRHHREPEAVPREKESPIGDTSKLGLVDGQIAGAWA